MYNLVLYNMCNLEYLFNFFNVNIISVTPPPSITKSARKSF
jgi:hypothetical protein